MVKQSDLVNPKSIEEYGSHANTDDEYEEYSEEEMLSEEELNEVGSSDEESNQKIPGGEEPDDKDSCTEESNEEDSDEEPEEPLEEEIEEDAPVEEIIEEEIREESEEELNGKEPLRSSVDQVCLVNGSDQVPSLLEVKKASDAVDDDEDFCTEDSDEELEEALEEDIEEDASVDEIIEEEISEELEQEPNENEAWRSSVDQLPLVNGSDQVPSLLEVKKASDAVDDDEDFCTDDSDEELEEALEEDIEEDASVDEIIEEEISEELEQEPNENEAWRSSVDQLPLVNDGDDNSSLLDAKKAADAVVDVPLVSTKRRRSGWDIKAEDVVLLNDNGDQCKSRKTRWSSGTKTETSMLVNDNTELNKTRKTRWSSDQRNSNLQLFHQKLDKFLKVKTLFPPTVNGDHLSKLLEQVDDSISKVVREYEKNKKPKLPPDHNFLFKKKLYFPSKEYPGYNFIGLILGPKGNTLKKMEEDTGATILLRGKSLSRKGEESYLDEDHVLIGADNQFYFDDAVRMVEKLLIPVDDRHNYHKVAQLRELAKIRGTLMEGKTHLANKDPCDICGKSDHLTSGCPLAATESHTNSNFPTGSGSLFSSNHPSNPGFAAVPPPSSNANLPSYPGFVGIPPPSLNANLPSYPGFAAVSLPSSNANLSYPGFTAVSLSSSNANLPSYPEFAAATLCSLNANLPSYPGFAAVSSSSSNSNLPSYSGLTALPSSSSNANLPSYPGFAAVSPCSSKANLPGYPGLASLLPSSSNANPPSYSAFAAIPPPSSNSDLPSYPGFAAIPPSSSIANLPSYPGFAAIPREIPESNKWPGPPGSILPESGLSFFESRYNSLVQSGSSTFQSSASLGKNADILGEKKLGITVTGTPSSLLNLNSTNYPGFTAITCKIPETNCWPPLPVSVLPESGTSFPKSGYDSLKYPETMPSQYSAYLSSTSKASISPYQLPSVHAESDELSSFPGYLKSIDTSHPLDQPASSSSLSSQSSYFTKNFSGNQMNPTW